MKQLVQVTIFASTLAAAAPLAGASIATAAPAPRLQITAPAGEVALGPVRIDRDVLADGKPLAAGTYEIQLTAREAGPGAVGASEALERWVEFRQDGQVRGREIVSIVPPDEIEAVANAKPPAPGTSRVEILKGDEYLRIWINRGGVNYLIHLPIA